MTAKKSLRFKVGDWIVHDNYGVGEVVDITDKDLDGQRETFFKVTAAEIEYWLPSDKADAEHIKRIRSKAEFDQALDILSEPPDLMTEPSHRNKRLINERWLDGSLPSRAALIRDLNGRNHTKELSYDEKRTFERAENFFINEWIISNPSLSKTKAKQKLNEALDLSIARENLEPKQVA
jgi:RNA polymerase-interacting CarD/CdnL/TRCF family regulator